MDVINENSVSVTAPSFKKRRVLHSAEKIEQPLYSPIQRLYVPFWNKDYGKVDKTISMMKAIDNKHVNTSNSYIDRRFMPVVEQTSKTNFLNYSTPDFGQEVFLGMSKSIKMTSFPVSLLDAEDTVSEEGNTFAKVKVLPDISDKYQSTVLERCKIIHSSVLAPYILPPKKHLTAVNMLQTSKIPRNLGINREKLRVSRNDTYNSLLKNELIDGDTINPFNEMCLSTTEHTSKSLKQEKILKYTGKMHESITMQQLSTDCCKQYILGKYNDYSAHLNFSQSTLRYIHSPYYTNNPYRRIVRQFPTKNESIAALEDDFFCNVIDWSSTNIIAIGFRKRVLLLYMNDKVNELCCLKENICSVSWSDNQYNEALLAIGTTSGYVHVFDTLKNKRISVYPIPISQLRSQKATTLAWNQFLLCSGHHNGNVIIRDIRCNAREENEFAHRKEFNGSTIILPGHSGQVCGLKWSPNKDLLATSGHDDKVIIRNLANYMEPFHLLKGYVASVKAMDWNTYDPYLLCAGGGSYDRTLKFWDTLTGNLLHSLHTGSQICNVAWSPFSNEFLTTHGYYDNDIKLWRYPSFLKLATIKAHSKRVLYMAKSPDGRSIVTGSSDGELKFWNVFSEPTKLECELQHDSPCWKSAENLLTAEKPSIEQDFDLDMIAHPSIHSQRHKKNKHSIIPIVR